MQLHDSEIRTREVTQWQGLHLLHYALSSCSQKVRILIGELGIPYTSHPVNLMRDKQRTDWYLGINPRGLVPVLVHDGKVHVESNDIIEYLNGLFASAENTLLPVTDAEQQEMRELMDLEDRLHADLRTVTFTYLAPDPSDHAPQLDKADYGYIGRLHDACTRLDQRLGTRPYLLGERMTLADVSWFITLHRLKRAAYPFEIHPNLKAYLGRIAQRPAFRKELGAGPLALRIAGSAYRTLKRLRGQSLARDYERWLTAKQQTAAH
ncbi:MAG: glutathione S-transferase family protein [Pseudomonadota bacterium]